MSIKFIKMVKENITTVNREDIKVIMNDVKNISGWVKSIDQQLKLINGTVRQHDKAIAILNEWRKMKSKAEDKLEMMSRGKFLAIFTAVLAVVGTIFLLALKEIIENLLG